MRIRTALAALIVGGTLFSLAACSGDTHVTQPTPTSVETKVAALFDPLTALTDPTSVGYISTTLTPLLHAKGSGPHTFAVDTSDPAVGQVKYFISCLPEATFTITMGVGFSSGCTNQLGNTGAIPIAERTTSTRVSVDVPEGIHYWIVGIPLNEESAGE